MPEPGPRMNGFSLGELCWLFCCPPCPSRIAAKLAFLPPEPTYTVLAPEQRGEQPPAQAAAPPPPQQPQPQPQQQPPEEAAAAAAAAAPGACSLHLSERADWQYSQRELDAVEVFFSRTARDNRLGCMFVRCAPSSRYTLLFSHGNAVDLGQMCSFYIGLGSRINCNIFSYDYSGYGVSSGKPSEKNLYADIDAAWQALRTRLTVQILFTLTYEETMAQEIKELV
ncbi:alpha/beta hydrolase domain-containing protein 17C-like isoform 3-T3 [Sarcophilus harrisii]